MAPVGELISSREQVSPEEKVKKVAERFFQEERLDSIAVVESGMPAGLVTRNKLMFSLFHKFGFALFERKPIIELTDTDPLKIHRSERVDVTLDKAMARPFEDVYDDIVVVGDGGSFDGLLSVKRIVLEQSNAFANSIVQRELAQAKARELEEMAKLKSQFIANVTHELRAPVNAIIGLAELLRMSADKGYIDQMRDRLTLLSSSALGLRAIITNILDLSKVEAGKMEVIREEFDVGEVLREAAETTRVLLGNKPVEVDVSLSGGPIRLFSDRVKFRQILTNLLANSAKFTDSGGITVRANRCPDGYVEVEVGDTGIGIRAEDMEKLFTAFTQLEDSKTKRYEGTGLGLTITRHLVDLLGGSISVESTFGEGTLFRVRLPIKTVQDERSAAS